MTGDNFIPATVDEAKKVLALLDRLDVSKENFEYQRLLKFINQTIDKPQGSWDN